MKVAILAEGYEARISEETVLNPKPVLENGYKTSLEKEPIKRLFGKFEFL